MPSDLYDQALAQSKDFHAKTGRFDGRYFLRYSEDVKKLIAQYACKTLLDYGCGKGVQWETVVHLNDDGSLEFLADTRSTNNLPLADWLGVEVTKYDPAYPAFAQEPTGTYDIVVCTQVLGSIPVVDLDWVVDRLSTLANKVVYVGEKLAPVKKQVHANMAEHMPHNWTRAQWVKALKRPGRKPTYLRTRDKATGKHTLGRV